VVLVAALAGVAAASSWNAVANGDFQTGSLAPWATFTTSNGTINGGDVQLFDTTGSGATLAAHFDAGEVSFTSNLEGGGISQSFFGSGTYTVSADVAVAANAGNYACGYFELLLDGTTVSSWNAGGYPSSCVSGGTYRAHLAAVVNTSNAATWHQVAVRITRPYITEPGLTPDQYVDNIWVIRKLTKVTPVLAPRPSAHGAKGTNPTGVISTG